MKATLIILSVLFSAKVFAVDGNNWVIENQRIYREQAMCIKSPQYCAAKNELLQLQIERLNTTNALRNVQKAPSVACANSAVRKAERASFDPVALKFPVRTSCENITEYKVALVKSQEEASALKAKLSALAEAIEAKTAEVAELQARIK